MQLLSATMQHYTVSSIHSTGYSTALCAVLFCL